VGRKASSSVEVAARQLDFGCAERDGGERKSAAKHKINSRKESPEMYETALKSNSRGLRAVSDSKFAQ
jgi:hypothetical protein